MQWCWTKKTSRRRRLVSLWELCEAARDGPVTSRHRRLLVYTPVFLRACVCACVRMAHTGYGTFAGGQGGPKRDVADDETGDLGCCFYILAFFSFLIIICFFPLSLIWSVKVRYTATPAAFVAEAVQFCRPSRALMRVHMVQLCTDCEGL